MIQLLELASQNSQPLQLGKEVTPSPQDLAMLAEAMTEKFTLKVEQFESDLYLDGVIQKPWGNEYRIYGDYFYDLWKLTLLPGCSTSMHCHPRKETALLCLAGKGKVHFLEQSNLVSPGDCIYIRKGVFHSTENIGNSLLELVEVETPRNKFDLVRSSDKYGRQGKLYEQKNLEQNILDINHIEYVCQGKIRNTCLVKKFNFGLRSGMDIICRPTENLMFTISLSVKNALSQDIQVFPSEPHQDLVENSNFYFTISQNL